MRDPMLPLPFRITGFAQELADTFTLEMVSATDSTSDSTGIRFAPGQFNMLYAFGVGEVPISISGDPGDASRLLHTVRAVGAVTRVMQQLRVGDGVGVRGPFGRPWPLTAARGMDVLVIAGGLGLAPLRPVILQLLAERDHYGRVCIFYGARSPAEMLYREQLLAWRGLPGLDVEVIVDHADSAWSGRVGVVTQLLDGGVFCLRHGR